MSVAVKTGDRRHSDRLPQAAIIIGVGLCGRTPLVCLLGLPPVDPDAKIGVGNRVPRGSVYDLVIEIKLESVKVPQQISHVHGVNVPIIPDAMGITVFAHRPQAGRTWCTECNSHRILLPERVCKTYLRLSSNFGRQFDLGFSASNTSAGSCRSRCLWPETPVEKDRTCRPRRADQLSLSA